MSRALTISESGSRASMTSCGVAVRVALYSGGIESDSQVGWLFPCHQLQEVLRESVKDRHVGSLGVDHGMTEEGVVHLEDECVSVN